MILLPRGNPVKENINPGKVNLPGALKKLQAGRFTGYLRFDGEQGTGVFIFEKGKLVSALFEAEQERLIAYDAVTRIFEESLLGRMSLDIYQLSPELALSVHGLLHGEMLYRGQELKLIDIKSLLARIRQERMNGCLRIYAGERIALIFYEKGNALGFFHDGSTDIETTADTSMSIARLPGAKVDVLSTKSLEELMLTDLQQSADLVPLWQRAQKKLHSQRRREEADDSRQIEGREKEKRRAVREFLQTTAEKHLGRMGANLAEKEFEKSTAGSTVITEATLVPFYVGMTRAAKLVAGVTSVNLMLDEMKKGVKPLIK